MTVQLGALLGQLGGPQSFESQGSWQSTLLQCSLSFGSGLAVHSSPGGLRVQVFSGASGRLRYDYAAGDDAYARWYTAVDTHAWVSLLWARVDDATQSGKFNLALTGANSLPVGFSAALQLYQPSGNVSSLGGTKLDINILATSLGAAGISLYVDDVTTYVDAITFPAEPGDLDDNALDLAQHQTATGRYAEYLWNQHGAWKFTTVAVPSSLGDTANGWHRLGLPILFNRETGDPAQTYIVDLIGAPPMTSLKHPYFDQSELSFTLQALRLGLNF